MIIFVKNKDTLLIDDFKFRCSIGKNGFSKKKLEGDLATPKGKFNLGNIYYRADRVQKPLSKLRSIPIKKDMGWCDDPKSKFYNRQIKIKDLTGAGDLFAAGYLHGVINQLDSKECLIKGTELSSKIIQKIGARI